MRNAIFFPFNFSIHGLLTLRTICARMRERVANRHLRLQLFFSPNARPSSEMEFRWRKQLRRLRLATGREWKTDDTRAVMITYFVPWRSVYTLSSVSIEERGGGTLSYSQRLFQGAVRPASQLALFFPFGFPCPRNRMADKMRYNVPSKHRRRNRHPPYPCQNAARRMRTFERPRRRSALVPSDALARKMSPAYRRRRRQPNHRNLDIQYTFSCTRRGGAEGRGGEAFVVCPFVASV